MIAWETLVKMELKRIDRNITDDDLLLLNIVLPEYFEWLEESKEDYDE